MPLESNVQVSESRSAGAIRSEGAAAEEQGGLWRNQASVIGLQRKFTQAYGVRQNGHWPGVADILPGLEGVCSDGACSGTASTRCWLEFAPIVRLAPDNHGLCWPVPGAKSRVSAGRYRRSRGPSCTRLLHGHMAKCPRPLRHDETRDVQNVRHGVPRSRRGSHIPPSPPHHHLPFSWRAATIGERVANRLGLCKPTRVSPRSLIAAISPAATRRFSPLTRSLQLGFLMSVAIAAVGSTDALMPREDARGLQH